MKVERRSSGVSESHERAKALPPPMSSVGQALLKWLRRILLLGVVLVGLSAVGVVLVIRHFEADLPNTRDLQSSYRPPQTTRILARDGTLLAELYTERRTVIAIESLPATVKLAVLAAEDAHFYEHEGLNYVGMLRALAINLRSGRTRQGASTITQQVVKNLLLDPERSYQRKVREIILARRLEQDLPKDKILELYLNHLYLGHGRYGIEEASRFYFGCSARDLTLAQAALLAGLIASPETYSPRHSLEKAGVRRRFVLDQMQEKGFITAGQHDAALKDSLTVAQTMEAQAELAPEAVEVAKRMLRKTVGDAAALGGYTVTTSIDPRMQATARKAVRDNLAAFDKRHGFQGPVPATPKSTKAARRNARAFEGTPHFAEHKIYAGEVTDTDDKGGLIHVRVGTVQGSIRLADYARYNPKNLSPSDFIAKGAVVRVSLLLPEPTNPSDPNVQRVPLRLELGPESALVALNVRSREVLALVGNYEAIMGGLDRATQARRQPGSTFKPIVYSYALHTRRFTPATLLETRPSTVAGYRPMNFEDRDGSQPTRLREALAQSIHVAAVHVGQEVGPSNIVSWAKALGITSQLGADLSLALGAYEVTPIDMANAYASFAAGGLADTARIVLRIVDPTGKEVPLPATPPPHRVMDENEAYLTTSLLTSVIDHGTAVRAKSLNRPLAGKTGTSNEAKDAWFVGYSTEIVAACWVGFDDSVSLGSAEAGSTAALPAWVQFMRAAHEGHPPTDFPRPGDIALVSIDPATGLRAWEHQEDAILEYFLPGTEPTEVAVADAGLDADGPNEGGAATDSGPLTVPSLEHDAETLPALPTPENPVPLF